MVRVAEADANWPELLDRVDAGEEVVIERPGRRSVQLRLASATDAYRSDMSEAEKRAWWARNTVDLGEDFDATAAVREDRDAREERLAGLSGR